MPRQLRRVIAGVLVALAVAMVTSRVAYRNEVVNDFTPDYVAARALFDGGDPYAPTEQLVARYLPDKLASYETDFAGERNPHTPFQIVLLGPLAMLSYSNARLAILALSLIAFVGAMTITARRFGIARAWAPIVASGFLILPPTQEEFELVQIHSVMLLLLVVGWWALSHRYQMVGGLALGCLAALKLYPLLLIIPLLKKRELRTIAWMLGSFAGLTGSSLALVGIQSTRTLLAVAGPENYAFWGSHPLNISLVGSFRRWMATVPPGWDSPSWILAILTLGLAVMVGLLMLLRTPAYTAGDLYWVAVPWMLLLTPLSWKFSMVLTYPLLLSLFVRDIRTRSAPRIRMLAIAATLVVLPFVPGLAGGASDTLFLVGATLPTFGLLALAAVDLGIPPEKPETSDDQRLGITLGGRG